MCPQFNSARCHHLLKGSMKQEEKCPKCGKIFWAQVWKAGHCPKCGKTFTWDSCGEDADEYAFIDWDPGFGPKFVEVGGDNIPR
jgi:predicted RNA-binding Zn-ribbon protein involved in translation (DUF1610 family)